jgi:hypothetical protein
MRSKLAYGVTLAAAAFCLSGCSYFRPTGPCFGTGCPARTVGQSGQYKLGQGPKPATAAATPPASQPQANQPAQQAPNQQTPAAQAPAQQASGQPTAPASGFSRLLAKLPFVGGRSVN